MVERLTVWGLALTVAVGCAGVVGCSGSDAPAPTQAEETIVDKLNSASPEKQLEGLNEADEKYGGRQ